MKKRLCLILALLLLLGMAGCSEPVPETQSTDGEGFSLTNSILGEDYLFAYPEVPQRIISLSSPATEMLLALGLEDSIVGYAMQDNEIPAQYKAAFDALHCITKDWTVSREMILALEPDFLMFWNGSADYNYCDFLIALRGGSVFASGAPKDVLTRENLRQLFQVDAIIDPDSGYIRYTGFVHP